MNFLGLSLALLSVFFLSDTAQASLTSIDFSRILTASDGRQISIDQFEVNAYAFSATNISDSAIDHYADQNFGYVLTNSPYPLAITLSRTDHRAFNREGFTIFVGGILAGGAVDFEVAPLAVNGDEGNPVEFKAGQLRAIYGNGSGSFASPFGQSIYSAAIGPFSDNSTLKIGGDVTHDTAFSFASAIVPVISQAPLPTTAWLFLISILGVMALLRKPNSQLPD